METRRLWRMWWSGLCAMVTGVHLLRAFSGIAITIGSLSVPVWVSWAVVPCTGFLSGWLMRHAFEGEEPHDVPPTLLDQLGGLHPQSRWESAASMREEPRETDSAYCGARVGSAEEEDEEDSTRPKGCGHR